MGVKTTYDPENVFHHNQALPRLRIVKRFSLGAFQQVPLVECRRVDGEIFSSTSKDG